MSESHSVAGHSTGTPNRVFDLWVPITGLGFMPTCSWPAPAGAAANPSAGSIRSTPRRAVLRPAAIRQARDAKGVIRPIDPGAASRNYESCRQLLPDPDCS
jgi:hypothetical protein